MAKFVYLKESKTCLRSVIRCAGGYGLYAAIRGEFIGVHADSDRPGIYAEQPGVWARSVIESEITGGHALGWADFDGDGNDELAVGWRDQKPGVAIYAVDRDGALKSKVMIDDGGMATEDLVVADLNGDKQPDIIASGRATRNVKIYWNETRTGAPLSADMKLSNLIATVRIAGRHHRRRTGWITDTTAAAACPAGRPPRRHLRLAGDGRAAVGRSFSSSSGRRAIRR